MFDRTDAIVFHLNQLRDKLRTAHLTDAARMAATARVQVETIRAAAQLIGAIHALHERAMRAETALEAASAMRVNDPGMPP